MIKIYVTDVSTLTADGAERLASSLPRWRRDKIGQLHITNQKKLSAGAGYLLAPALNSFGVNADDAEICVNKYGKPYLSDFPNVHFSLSHSGNMAMCAVADSPVGCDIQQVSGHAESSLKVAKRFFTPSEYERIAAAEKPELEFVRLWTLKESYVKYLGRGIAGCPLNSFEITDQMTVKALPEQADEMTVARQEMPHDKQAGTASPRFSLYCFDDHIAAVCCAQTTDIISQIKINI